jgi:N,N'-diacetylchitobiose transport system permease protein
MRHRWLPNTVAVMAALVTVFPIYWMVLSAFKPTGEIESAHPRP